MSTLRFASRARLVKAIEPTRVVDPKDVVILALRQEIESLKEQLTQGFPGMAMVALPSVPESPVKSAMTAVAAPALLILDAPDPAEAVSSDSTNDPIMVQLQDIATRLAHSAHAVQALAAGRDEDAHELLGVRQQLADAHARVVGALTAAAAATTDTQTQARQWRRDVQRQIDEHQRELRACLEVFFWCQWYSLRRLFFKAFEAEK
jgi:hypothetical protein